VAGEAEHGDVVPVVADGENVGGGEAADLDEVLEGGGFGAAGGQDVEDGEVVFGVGGAVECDLGGGGGEVANGRDEGVKHEVGFGLAHAVDGAAEHHLDGWILVGMQGIFEAVDVGDVGLVGAHPAADAGVEIVEVLDDEGTASVFAVEVGEVEGEDQGVAVVGEVGAEPAGGGEREVGAAEEFGADGADDGAVGADDGGGGVEAEVAEDVHGEAVTAAGGDDDFGAGGLGEVKGGEVAGADAAGGV
jgi:hypothetical protein